MVCFFGVKLLLIVNCRAILFYKAIFYREAWEKKLKLVKGGYKLHCVFVRSGSLFIELWDCEVALCCDQILNSL